MAKSLITFRPPLLPRGLAWPLVSTLGLGQLPGDLRVERKASFHFPITSSIVVSLLVTLVLWIFRR